MKRALFLVIALFFSMISAQQKSFLYEVSYRPSPVKDSLKTEKAILDVVGAKSVFRLQSAKKYDSIYTVSGNSQSLTIGFDKQFYIIKDLKTNTVEKFIQNFQDNFLLKIESTGKSYRIKQKSAILTARKPP